MERRARALVEEVRAAWDGEAPDPLQARRIELVEGRGPEHPRWGQPHLVIRVTALSGHGEESAYQLQWDACLWQRDGVLARGWLTGSEVPSQELAELHGPDEVEGAWSRVRAFLLGAG